jgi:hypothetical protein
VNLYFVAIVIFIGLFLVAYWTRRKFILTTAVVLIELVVLTLTLVAAVEMLIVVSVIPIGECSWLMRLL